MSGMAYGTCDNCGALSTLPDTNGESIHKESSPGMDSILRRANMFVEDGDFDKAAEYFNRILDSEPENASAYWGLLMSKQHCRTEEQLANCYIENENEYKKALRFANAEQAIKYQSIAGMFRQSINQKFDSDSKTIGSTIVSNGEVWDFIKSVNYSDYFRKIDGDNPTIEWYCDNIPADTNPVVRCNNAKVVIVNTGSITIEEILPALEKTVLSNAVILLVICEPCNSELLQLLLMNSVRNVFKSIVFLLPDNKDNRNQLISEISNVTGAKVFANPTELTYISDADFGVAGKFYACGDRAMFVASQERLEQIKKNEARQIEEEQQRMEKLKKTESRRICRYCGGTLSFFKKCKSCGEVNR